MEPAVVSSRLLPRAFGLKRQIAANAVGVELARQEIVDRHIVPGGGRRDAGQKSRQPGACAG